MIIFSSGERKRRPGYHTVCIACSHLCQNVFLCIKASPSLEEFTPQLEQQFISGVEITAKTFCVLYFFFELFFLFVLFLFCFFSNMHSFKHI